MKNSPILEKYLTSLSGKEQFDILYNLPMGLRIWFEGSFMKRKVLGGAADNVPRALQNAKKLIDLLGLKKNRPNKLYRLISIPREQDCEKYARMKNKIVGVSKNDYQSWAASKQAAEKFFKDVYSNFKTDSRWVFMIVEGVGISDTNIIASYPEIISLLQVLRDYIKGVPQQKYDQTYLPGVEIDKRTIFTTIHYTLKDLSRKWYANQQEVVTHIPSKKVRVSQAWVLQCNTPIKQQKEEVGRLQELIEAEVRNTWHSDDYTQRVKKPAVSIPGGKFELSAFSKLTTSREMLEYAKNTLGKRLGAGSSRIVYKLPDKKTVLKIAWDGDRDDGIQAGMAQNRAEATASDFSKGSFFTNVLQKGPGYRWIISEYARKTGPREFKELSGGLTFGIFNDLIQAWDEHKGIPEKKKRLYQDDYFVNKLAATIRSNKWFADFLKFMQVGNILPGDFQGWDHWGVVESDTPRLVVLDYGYTTDTKKKFYNWEE